MKHTVSILALCFSVMVLSGCAEKRVSLKDIQDYDKAIKIAEQEGLETKEMHKHLVDMFISYMKRPGPDPYLAAMQQSANAQTAAAFSAAMQNMQVQQQMNRQPMPLSPVEYQRAIGR